MKNRILFLIFIVISLTSPVHQVFGQGNRMIFLGLENNKFGIAGFSTNGWEMGLKHSLFSENIRKQYIQINAGYQYPIKDIAKIKLIASYGTTYDKWFYDTKANLSGELYPIEKLTISAAVQPHYDSGMDYSTYYSVGLKFRLLKQISLTGTFENIPEYRVSEERVKLGVLFNVENLFVLPEISIPTNSDQSNKFRVLCSFRYNFDI